METLKEVKGRIPEHLAEDNLSPENREHIEEWKKRKTLREKESPSTNKSTKKA